MNLSRQQIQFLQKELSVSEDEVSNMTMEDWHQVRERCLDIEVEEAVKEDTEDAVDWERCDMAASIVNIKFCQLH